MNYCPHCGTPCDGSMRFCTACGKPITETNNAQQPPPQQPFSQQGWNPANQPNNGNWQNPVPFYPAPYQKPESTVCGIIGLCLGIASYILWFFDGIGILCAIAALTLGIIQVVKNKTSRGFGIASIVLGSVNLLLTLLLVFLVGAVLFAGFM